MISFPGEESSVLMVNGKPFREEKCPEVGMSVKARVIKSTFTQATLQIFEVENHKTFIEYKAFMRPAEFSGDQYLCDKVKKGDILDCIVLFIGDQGIYLTL